MNHATTSWGVDKCVYTSVLGRGILRKRVVLNPLWKYNLALLVIIINKFNDLPRLVIKHGKNVINISTKIHSNFYKKIIILDPTRMKL